MAYVCQTAEEFLTDMRLGTKIHIDFYLNVSSVLVIFSRNDSFLRNLQLYMYVF